jgi:hypothetical protein
MPIAVPAVPLKNQNLSNPEPLPTSEQNNPDPEPNPTNPADLAERAKIHAIARWRSHVPRPPRTPTPDDYWIHECPCGAQIPCAAHGELWRELRYHKPWDSSYSNALKARGIPLYEPTQEELSMTPKPAELSTQISEPRESRNLNVNG